MKVHSLNYEAPPEPHGWPAWRDVFYTWPGCFIGGAVGTSLSLLYLTPVHIGGLAVILSGVKLAAGVGLMQSDRFRWLGLGVLLSILAGFVIIAGVALSNLPVC